MKIMIKKILGFIQRRKEKQNKHLKNNLSCIMMKEERYLLFWCYFGYKSRGILSNTRKCRVVDDKDNSILKKNYHMQSLFTQISRNVGTLRKLCILHLPWRINLFRIDRCSTYDQNPPSGDILTQVIYHAHVQSRPHHNLFIFVHCRLLEKRKTP